MKRIVDISGGFASFFKGETGKRKREHEAEHLRLKLEKMLAYDGVITSFAGMLDMKSAETGEHVRRVADYTACLCRNLGFSPDLVHDISVASMMHDVGKLLVPNEILEKRDSLTDEDFAELRLHVIYGDMVMERADCRIMRLARDIAREHHERWDGTGYAQGKKGTEISEAARIVAVADVFDALTGRRSYKEPWSPEEAKAEIIAKSGSHFDPEMVENFVSCYPEIRDIWEEYMSGENLSLRTA